MGGGLTLTLEAKGSPRNVEAEGSVLKPGVGADRGQRAERPAVCSSATCVGEA